MLNKNKEATIIRGKGNIYIITNQNRELYSDRPQDFEHSRPDHEHFKSASQIGAAWGPRQLWSLPNQSWLYA